MLPKAGIYALRRDNEHTHPFHMGFLRETSSTTGKTATIILFSVKGFPYYVHIFIQF